MKPNEWRRRLNEIARRAGGYVEDRGDKLVIKLPNGSSVWCAKTPGRPAIDHTRKLVARKGEA